MVCVHRARRDGESDGTRELTAGFGLDAAHPLVEVVYAKDSGTIDYVQLNTGATGTLEFHSRPYALDDHSKPNPNGVHTYAIAAGSPILRDGQPLSLQWVQNIGPATELFDALMYTYAPDAPSTQTDCVTPGLCMAMLNVVGGDGVAFGARPLGLYFHAPPNPGIGWNTITPDFLYAFAHRSGT